MFGLFGKKSQGKPSETMEPSVDWDPKTQVLTLQDKHGRKTVRKNPFPIPMWEHEVVKMEIIREKVHFTVHPKAQHNKDGKNKPRTVVFDLRGKLVGGRIL